MSFLLTNYAHTPTVLYGPGSIQQAHGIDEYVSLEEFYTSIEVLANAIYQWCR